MHFFPSGGVHVSRTIAHSVRGNVSLNVLAIFADFAQHTLIDEWFSCRERFSVFGDFLSSRVSYFRMLYLLWQKEITKGNEIVEE